MRGLRLLLTATTAILGALADSSIATGAPKDAPPGGTEAGNDALHPWNVGVVHPWNVRSVFAAARPPPVLGGSIAAAAYLNLPPHVGFR
jgi:hypothetical protein